MINASKSRESRFWAKWACSGALGNINGRLFLTKKYIKSVLSYEHVDENSDGLDRFDDFLIKARRTLEINDNKSM